MLSNAPLHPWTLDPYQGIRLQENLNQSLVLAWDEHPVKTIGGVDVIYAGDMAQAAIAVLRFPDMHPLSMVNATMPLSFPYIPGLLAFRTGPVILAAWEKLSIRPDVLLLNS
jgi:deoxyribonuclease V